MLKAVLFDLDNTLLLFDERKFFQRYFQLISSYFADLMEPEVFARKLKNASEVLVRNDGTALNSRFFMQEFMHGLDLPEEKVWQRFVQFYETQFCSLQSLTTPAPGVQELFGWLERQNFRVAIATNPLFPLSAQRQRLSWAGLGWYRFDFITHIENTHYCKPHPGYFLEVSQALKVQPSECLLVGNDALTDLPAGDLAMTTYLTTDSQFVDLSKLEMSRALYAGQNHSLPKPDFRGPLVRLMRLLPNLAESIGY